MDKFIEQTKTELRLRNYSRKTIESYVFCLREYFDFKKDNLDSIDEESIKTFLLNKQDKDAAPQTINLFLNAIKFFYRDVIKNPRRIETSRVKLCR